MPNPPTENIWTITNKGSAVGNALTGMHIVQPSETTLSLVPQNPTAPALSTITALALPVTFKNVSIAGATWDITVDDLPNSIKSGSWVTPSQNSLKAKDTPPQSGDFTSQAGSGLGEDAAASSAKG